MPLSVHTMVRVLQTSVIATNRATIASGNAPVLRHVCFVLSRTFVRTRQFLLIICYCLTGRRRHQGCSCRTVDPGKDQRRPVCGTGDCPCFAANRECDPDLCGRCGAREAVENGKPGVALCYGHVDVDPGSFTQRCVRRA
jgi:hypothetical protein